MEMLVGLAGYLVGTSSSPEMWIAAAAVVTFGTSRFRFIQAFVFAAACLVGFRLVIVPGYNFNAALGAATALLIISLAGAAIRHEIGRAQRRLDKSA